jgi:hypothetical protein
MGNQDMTGKGGVVFTPQDFAQASFAALVVLARQQGMEFRMKVTNESGDFVWVNSSLTDLRGIVEITTASVA